MARIKRAVAARKQKKDYLKAAKGYTGGRRRLWRTVRNAVDPADAYRTFRGRDARIDAVMRSYGFPVPE